MMTVIDNEHGDDSENDDVDKCHATEALKMMKLMIVLMMMR